MKPTLVAILLVSACCAQNAVVVAVPAVIPLNAETISTPKPRARFVSMRTPLLTALSLSSSAADAYFTQRNFGPGFHESDTLARPFVHSTPQLVIFSAGLAAGKIYLPYALRKSGHRHMARTAEIVGIGLSTGGAITSAQGYRR